MGENVEIEVREVVWILMQWLFGCNGGFLDVVLFWFFVCLFVDGYVLEYVNVVDQFDDWGLMLYFICEFVFCYCVLFEFGWGEFVVIEQLVDVVFVYLFMVDVGWLVVVYNFVEVLVIVIFWFVEELEGIDFVGLLEFEWLMLGVKGEVVLEVLVYGYWWFWVVCFGDGCIV